MSEQQGGVLSRRQLVSAGMPITEIDWLIRCGRLECEDRRPGVYRAPGADLGAKAEVWASVLAAEAVLSYHSAASTWGLPVEGDGRVHITVEDRSRVRPRRGLRVHRVLLPSSSWTVRNGLPITTKIETLFDCLGALPRSQALSLADRALQQRWMTTTELAARLRQQPGRWGNVQLRMILDRLDPAVEAESERRFHQLLRNGGIEGWIPQYEVTVGGRIRRVDVALPGHKIAIEIDGRTAHSELNTFVDDRRRQNDLVRAGWTVLRYTWDDIVNRPWAIVAELKELLAR